MNNDKVCQFCLKSVPIEAVKCPYCQEWINIKKLSLRNPIVRTASVMVLFFSLFVLFPRYYFVKKLHSVQDNPQKYKSDSKLYILKHRLNKGKQRLSVIGELENKENFKWESVSVLITFKNKSNEVSNVATGYIVNVGPGLKKNFEVSIGCSGEPYDTDVYSTYTIEIEEARGEYKPISLL